MPATATASSGSRTAGSSTRRRRPSRRSGGPLGRGPHLAFLFLALGGAPGSPLAAQQLPDTAFRPPIARTAFPPGRGPVVAIDEAHRNFHTLEGRYAPFAELLRRGGYRVVANRARFDQGALDSTRLLVVANAIAAENETLWVAPIHPAFTPAEVEAVREWVERGGALFLLADHMPFGGAAATLGRAFGFELSDGFAGDSGGGELAPFSRAAGTLRPHPVTDGRDTSERVDVVRTFTGQAFRAPPDAAPLLVLPGRSLQRFPDTAWVFSPTTRSEDASGLLQGAVRQVGRGRVAVFGEAAMFTAQLAGPRQVRVGMNAEGAEDNAALLRNLVRWLTERR